MNIVRTNRNEADFYRLLGPYFGSRRIEKETRDRFYDDPGKTWYVTSGGVASVLGGSIRNFWAEDNARAKALLAAMLEDGAVTGGIVPRLHEDAFAEMGFSAAPHRKNFLEVYYEKH